MRSESQDIRIWKTLTQYYKGVLDSDPLPHPGAWTQGFILLESQMTLQGT